jgi:hypothetical protein
MMLLPLERKALPEHYRRSYVAKRQEFFCNIQHTYELWRYFQMLDWNFRKELDHMSRLGGQESASPLALFSKAHAKIRIAIELAFARCTEEARPIMRDAIRLAVCAHRLRVDAGCSRSGGARVIAWLRMPLSIVLLDGLRRRRCSRDSPGSIPAGCSSAR